MSKGKTLQLCMVRLHEFEALPEVDTLKEAVEIMTKVAVAYSQERITKEQLFDERDKLMAERLGTHKWGSKSEKQSAVAAPGVTPMKRKAGPMKAMAKKAGAKQTAKKAGAKQTAKKASDSKETVPKATATASATPMKAMKKGQKPMKAMKAMKAAKKVATKVSEGSVINDQGGWFFGFGHFTLARC